MTGDYRDRLFATYSKTHLAFLDPDDQTKLDWFLKYARRNYLRFIDKFDRESATILEVGCNKGYLLAALSSFDFRNLFGVDLSPDDAEKAKALLPNADVACADAFEYLDDNQEKFDIIILKAVLEHVQKDKIIPFLVKIKKGLKPGGTVIIDVPNMDWLFAQHERYMDFTHEVGFTRESLAQVMRNVFDDVVVVHGLPIEPSSTKARVAAFSRPLLIYMFNLVLRIIGEGASSVWWHSRSIVGVGKK
jgi:2-polyprenyl-3-methyl-5-hydroxy-6-metoxy-1,4-benzoquinol methylase